ncbi:hypothetical protein PFISCL1PPCAC_7546, partial [Pristionchus fissidentatus]
HSSRDGEAFERARRTLQSAMTFSRGLEGSEPCPNHAPGEKSFSFSSTQWSIESSSHHLGRPKSTSLNLRKIEWAKYCRCID